jgi:hypothetical protein
LEGIVPCVELDLSSAASHLPGSLEYPGSGAPCSRTWRALRNHRACRAQYLDFIALPYGSPRLRSSRSLFVLAHHRETPDLRACDFASQLGIVCSRAILLRRTLGRDLRAYRGSLYVLLACCSLRCRGSRSCIGLSPFSALSASASIRERSGGRCAYGSGRRTGILIRTGILVCTCFEYAPRVDNGTQRYHPGGPIPSVPIVRCSYTAPIALYRTCAFRCRTTCLRLSILCPSSRAASASYTCAAACGV